MARKSNEASSVVKCRILRAIWDKDGQRQDKGSIVELDVDTAMDMLEKGVVAREKE